MKRASQKGVTVRGAVLNSALTTPVCGLNISSRLGYCRKSVTTEWIECFADYLSRVCEVCVVGLGRGGGGGGGFLNKKKK